ncbi:MAG: SPASM domain-containing protein [Elusimicrobiota bacterium]|nr:SPASM domain-containing protein [Endomicrobiia bacterium]MDW8166402.1 SPASM domain-containing protein [Elusimicrobiota bacterium]
MKKFYIRVTDQCNLFCKHCYIPNDIRTKKKSFLSPDQVKFIVFKGVEELLYSRNNENEFLNIIFTGGEPMLVGVDYYKSILSDIEKIKNEKVSFSMTTNLMLYSSKWDFIFQNLFGGVVGTSYSLTRQTVNGFDDFEKIWLKNYERVREKFNVSIIFTLDKIFISQNVEFWINKIKQLEPHSCSFEWFIPAYDEIENSEIYSSVDEYFDYLCKLFSALKESGIKNVKIKQLRPNFNMFSKDSSCLDENLVINPDGSVGICPALTVNGFVSGNIFYESIHKLLNKKERIDMINMLLKTPKECEDCRFVAVCNYGCPALIFLGKIQRNNCKKFFEFLEKHYFEEASHDDAIFYC